jgi:hypothetical protein
MDHAKSPVRILVTLLGVCLIIAGCCLLFKVFTLPLPPLWVSAIFMIIGLTLIAPSDPKLQITIGILLLGTGTFAALRTIDIITKPWVQYGLGGFLIFVGVALILNVVMGGTQNGTAPKNTN